MKLFAYKYFGFLVTISFYLFEFLWLFYGNAFGYFIASSSFNKIFVLAIEVYDNNT